MLSPIMKEKFIVLTKDARFWYILGLIITLAATSIELLRGRAENYVDFRDATINFFNGVSSYTPEYVAAHGRYFIYSPVFHYLFAPFAYMPLLLGGYLWNLLGWTVFYYAIKTLPGELNRKAVPMLAFLLLFVMQTVFCFQYNLLVTCIFLLAFTLFEREQPFMAILLIMLSATTKIYGIVELALLFCYPHFWRNMGYTLACGVGFTILPATKLGFSGLLPWYMDWFHQLTDHCENTCQYYSLIWAQPFQSITLPNMRIFQIAVLVILAICFLLCRKQWTDYRFKIGVLATLMIYIVLMSEAAEFTTHTISVTGYALWYFLCEKRNRLDQILFWSIFVLFGVMPIDLFCPSDWCLWIHKTLWLGVWVFTVAWVREVWETIQPGLTGLKKKD